VNRESDRSTITIILVFLVIIAAFWVLIGNFLQVSEPKVVYLNETNIEPVMDQTIRVKLNTYEQIPLDVKKGDILNVTVTVKQGGPIDYFILNGDQVKVIVDALSGKNNRFQSYERGRGLNITYMKTEFSIVSDKDWYIFVNNEGHIQGGARPIADVLVQIDVEKIGYNEADQFSYPS
jgi:hypothetical protein